MLFWSAIFFIVALVAGFFGFYGLADVAAAIAQFLFVAFLVIAAAFLAAGIWAANKTKRLLK